ncbi:MAG: LTA synthase family protein [Gemmatimonadaceae bacterium]
MAWLDGGATSRGLVDARFRRAGDSLLAAARQLPEGLLLLAMLAATVAWAVHRWTLPGRDTRFLGIAVAGVLWACLYAILGLVYQRLARQWSGHGRSTAAGHPSRFVWRRLGLVMIMAPVATMVCALLLAPLLDAATRYRFFYLWLFLPAVFLAVGCAALLPRQTGALVAAGRSGRSPSPWLELALLLGWAALLVSAADMALHWWSSGTGAAQMRMEMIEPVAWLTNTLVVFSALALVFALTSRMATSLLLVTLPYVVLGVATIAKLRYMHSAVQPLDLLRIGEFLPLFQGFFGTAALVITVVVLTAWGLAVVAAQRGRRSSAMSGTRRGVVALVSASALLVCPGIFLLANPPGWARTLGWRLGAPTGQWEEHARVSGFLLSFLSEIPSVRVSVPPTYSPSAVTAVAGGYSWSAGPPVAAPATRPGVNLIIYLVESLVDPDRLGVRFTSDPVPNLTALQESHGGGYAIVPEQFGGSANTEFELLTGMATAFLPRGSTAYRQQLRRPVPSLPRALGKLGYQSIAIQAGPRYFYDRERAYDLLGFHDVSWLFEEREAKRARDGWWPADEAVVQSVIQASRQRRPFFIFAFPASAHSPYTTGIFRESALDVADPDRDDPTGEVKEFINRARVADSAIGTLVRHFRQRPDSTIIVILGDHLPPLSGEALRSFSALRGTLPPMEQERMARRVPLVIWANFDLPVRRVELGTSALPAYLLRRMGIAPSGFLALTDAVHRDMPVVSSYVQRADGTRWRRDGLPARERRLLDDYWLLQYDLLLGRQYALVGTPIGGPARIARPATPGRASPAGAGR